MSCSRVRRHALSNEHVPLARRPYVEPLRSLSFGEMDATCPHCHAFIGCPNALKTVPFPPLNSLAAAIMAKSIWIHSLILLIDLASFSQRTPQRADSSENVSDSTTVRSLSRLSPPTKKSSTAVAARLECVNRVTRYIIVPASCSLMW
jgi:hypothetical protein